MNPLSQFFQNIALVGFVFSFLVLFLRDHRSDSGAVDRSNHDLAWWITITTKEPSHQYFFGPFETKADAQAHQGGFIKDLSEEGVAEISSEINWCQPKTITSNLSHSTTSFGKS